MDRRVFQPRPNGNDVRQRNAIGMAAIVLLAAWLWTLVSRGTGTAYEQPPQHPDRPTAADRRR